MRSCFFIGHRNVTDDILSAVNKTVERYITEYDTKFFTVGHYGQFDRLAAKAVLVAKRRYPDVKLTLLLPYHPGEQPIRVPDGFDNTFYPPGMEYVPRRFAIVRANRYMIDNSDYLIAYVWHAASGARNLLEYAQRREDKGLIHIENLGDSGF